MNKNELRNQAKKLRSELDYAQIELISQSVIKGITSISEFKNRNVFHLFYPITKKKEVDLRTLIPKLWESGKTVVMPRVSEEGTLSHHKIHSFEEIESTKWGMMEPGIDLPKIDPTELDVIIVPMLMADIHKNRLGYGAGFYDQFLAQAQQAIKIGVLGEMFITNHVPTEEHDVHLDAVVTDKRIII